MPKLEFLVVAEITRPHGVAGELKARSWSDEPERLEGVERVFTLENGAYVARKVLGCRAGAGIVRWRWEGVDSFEAANALRGTMVYVRREDAAPLEPGAHYIAELEGCTVVDVTGRQLGVLAQVFRTGANDVYLVRGDRDLYLPAIGKVVKNVDIDAGIITVDASMILEAEDVKD